MIIIILLFEKIFGGLWKNIIILLLLLLFYFMWVQTAWGFNWKLIVDYNIVVYSYTLKRMSHAHEFVRPIF